MISTPKNGGTFPQLIANTFEDSDYAFLYCAQPSGHIVLDSCLPRQKPYCIYYLPGQYKYMIEGLNECDRPKWKDILEPISELKFDLDFDTKFINRFHR